MNNERREILIQAVNKASAKWKSAFNLGDAVECANQYAEAAVMKASFWGVFRGTAEIQAFWQQAIDRGLTDVEYHNVQIEIVDETSAVLTADWTMNLLRGVIHRELWVLQADGRAKLLEDYFEAFTSDE